MILSWDKSPKGCSCELLGYNAFAMAARLKRSVIVIAATRGEATVRA
jgi:hypothetical protein